VLGHDLGTFNFSVKDGLTLNINLGLASGTIKIYAEGNTLYADVNIKVIFDGEYKKDHIKLISW
jgi:hypothetical protein